MLNNYRCYNINQAEYVHGINNSCKIIPACDKLSIFNSTLTMEEPNMKFHTAIFIAAMFLIFSLFNFNASASHESQSMRHLPYMLMADNDTDIELEQYDTEDDSDEDTEDAYEEEEDSSENILQDDIDSDSESDVEDTLGTDEEDVAQKLGAALDQAAQEEPQAVQAGTMPKECATAAGHIIIMLDEHGINNGISYIKPEAEVEFSNQSGETHKITISPSGFVDQDSFTVPPHRSVSVYASSPLSVTVGKVDVITNGTHTKFFLVICP
jgi:hypothetical protein